MVAVVYKIAIPIALFVLNCIPSFLQSVNPLALGVCKKESKALINKIHVQTFFLTLFILTLCTNEGALEILLPKLDQ